MKFHDFFSTPQYMSNGDHAIDGTLSREVAAAEISHYVGKDIKPEQLKPDRVRFGFPGEDIEYIDGRPCWCSRAGNGRGTKPIWVFER